MCRKSHVEFSVNFAFPSTDSGYRNQQTQLPLRGQYWLKPVSRLMLRSVSNRFFQAENKRTPKSRADGRADVTMVQEKII
jgi:hypothetical protein